MRRSGVWNKAGKKPKEWRAMPYHWKQGKGARRTARGNAANKARFERLGIRHCQLCGSGTRLSNSHTLKSDRRVELAETALLCTEPCHQFLEAKCTADERAAVNRFLIETGLEGEDRFRAAVALLPGEKAQLLESMIRRALL